MSCLHEALQPPMITFVAREVYSEFLRADLKEIGVVEYPAMKPDMNAREVARYSRHGCNCLCFCARTCRTRWHWMK
jgi:hypothetical protein